MFFHRLANILYTDLVYEERYNNTIAFLFLIGIMGMVLGKIIDSKLQKYSNIIVSKGIFMGGCLLILSVVINNWHYMEEVSKLLALGGIFGICIMYAYKNNLTINKD